MRLSWLADSIWSRRTRLGTDASLAGIQNRLTHSIRKLATSSQTRVCRVSTTRCASGIVRNSPNRTKSEMTMVMRRSNRSANAPASGPSTIAGSSFTTRTPPSA